MNHFRRLFPLFAWRIVAVAGLGLGGCKDLFIAKQTVLVDSISAPGIAKLAGQSYRLVARKSVVTVQTAQLPVIAACVNSALTMVGMYEAPPSVPSDVFIELTYGMDTSSRVDPATRESFLQLSARANHARSLEPTHEEELWDVRVAIAGLAGRLETAMPLLSQVAATYAGTDTHVETTIRMMPNAPAIVAVRENAVKILETNNDAGASPQAVGVTK